MFQTIVVTVYLVFVSFAEDCIIRVPLSGPILSSAHHTARKTSENGDGLASRRRIDRMIKGQKGDQEEVIGESKAERKRERGNPRNKASSRKTRYILQCSGFKPHPQLFLCIPVPAESEFGLGWLDYVVLIEKVHSIAAKDLHRGKIGAKS